MQKLLRAVLVVVSIGLSGSAFAAAEHGSKEEAVAMVHKVIAYIKANGKDKAIAEVNTPKGQFIDRDLYVTIGDAAGIVFAHGANPKLVGKNLGEVKDMDGKAFVKEGSEILKTKSSGWVDYKWPNPVSKQIENKSMYFEKLGDLVINVGVYRD